MRVLITGIAGSIGQIVARKLVDRGDDVCGIDIRPWPGAPASVEVHRCDIRKRAAEDVFRRVRPEGVVHMATVTHLRRQSEDRYRINMHGTRAVFDHCHNYGARHAVFVGRHTYYGAEHDSPLYHGEDDPPIAVTSFPELADLVAADLYAGSALWRYPDLSTVVLRICYTLGPSLAGTLATFLRAKRVPTILGFDPLFQFMHDEDAADAICVGLRSGLRGVFNVAGPAPVPLSVLIEHTGGQRVPIPQALFKRMTGRFGLPRLPAGAVQHLKYAVVIDGSAFRAATGFQHQWDEVATMSSYRAAVGHDAT